MPRPKILIIINKLIGDNVAALNAVYSLYRHYLEKGFSFHLLGYPYSIKLYEKLISAEKIFYLNDSKDYHHKVKTNVLKLILKLKKERYQMAFILPGGFFFAWISFLSRIKMRVGHQSDFRSFLLTHPIPLRKDIPNYRNYDNLLNAFKPSLRYLKSPLMKTKLDFKKHGIRTPYIVISPKSSEKKRTWPKEKFSQLSERIKKELKVQIVYVGLATERKSIEEMILSDELNLAGTISLLEVFYLIENCQFFVGNDSGLGHIAGQLGVLSFIVLGPTNFVLSKPRGDQTHLIYREIPGLSAFERRKNPPQEANIDEVTVDEVFSKIQKHFSFSKNAS